MERPQATALAAVVIHSPDPERLADFYHRALGTAEPKRYRPTHLGIKLPNGYLGFEQGEAGGRPEGRMTLWFGVADVEEAYPRWLALGAHGKSPPSWEESAGEIVASLYDPEGNVIGLVRPASAPPAKE